MIKNIQAIKYASLALISLSAIFSLYYFLISPPPHFPTGSIVSVKSGSVLIRISADLKEEGIIRSRFALEFFSILFGGDRHIVSGDYFFDRPLPVWSVAYRISLGQYHIKAVKITIPEGYNSRDITDVLSTNILNFDKERFLAEVAGKEGHLFPDTYFLYPNMTPEVIAKILEDNFIKKITPLENSIVKSGKSEKEIITMASIIEKESGGPDDKAYIAGILWKRIKLKMRLQVDATIVYLTGRDGTKLASDDFKINSLYNTYTHLGLPPAPISNPGLDSIKAAIFPKDSPYLFYLHDKNGVIHYAKTFKEHIANELKYLNN